MFTVKYLFLLLLGSHTRYTVNCILSILLYYINFNIIEIIPKVGFINSLSSACMQYTLTAFSEEYIWKRKRRFGKEMGQLSDC
jgi:hypothetical protein